MVRAHLNFFTGAALLAAAVLAYPSHAVAAKKTAKQPARAVPAHPTTHTLPTAPTGAMPASQAPPIDGAPHSGGLAPASTGTAEHLAGPTTPATLALLRQLEAKNAAIKTVHAQFDQTREDPTFMEQQTSPGELWFEKPARLRIDIGGTVPGIVLVDGMTFYSYDKKLNQVNFLKFDSAAERDARLYNFLIAFGFKTEDLVQHFSIESSEDAAPLRKELADGKLDPAAVALLRVKPQATFAEATPFTELKIWIDKKTQLPQKLWYHEAGGSGANFTMAMKAIDFPQNLAQNYFSAKAVLPANAEAIPLNQNRQGE